MDLSAAGSPFLPRDGFLVVDLERFQGPLDLLLHLIRTQDIDVFDIPIARITKQFLAAIEGIGPADLDHAGEFLEMAATLVRIKAQMLLPRHGEDEELDPRAELVRRLLEYEQIREISRRLEASEAERARLFPKGYVEPRPRPELSDTPLETTWDEVFQAALGVTLPDPIDRGHRVALRPVAMEDKVALILEALQGVARVEFSRLLKGLEGIQAKMHGVMTFLASLEMTRRRDLFMRQARPFSELWLYRREEDEGDEEGEAAARTLADGDREADESVGAPAGEGDEAPEAVGPFEPADAGAAGSGAEPVR